MGRKCTALGCKSGYGGRITEQRITMHGYPRHDQDLLKKWINANPRQDFIPSIYSSLCSIHFKESDFVEESQDSNKSRKKTKGKGALERRYLKKGAVPSIFPNAPSYLSTSTAQPRQTAKATAASRFEADMDRLENREAAFQNANDISDCSLDEICSGLKSAVAVPAGYQGQEINSKFNWKRMIDAADVHHPDLCEKIDSVNKRYCCGVCQKTFACMSALVRHFRIHTGEKPFSCNLCGKTFNQPSSLKLHIRTHTGEKPYSCKVCEKAFTKSCTLKKHMRTHTGEKPYSCQFCQETFDSTSCLERHMQMHPGVKSSPRDQHETEFADPSSQKAHVKSHWADKPHSLMMNTESLICPEPQIGRQDPIITNNFDDGQSPSLILWKEIKSTGTIGKINLDTSTQQKQSDSLVTPVTVETFRCNICEGLSVDEALFHEHFGNHRCAMEH